MFVDTPGIFAPAAPARDAPWSGRPRPGSPTPISSCCCWTCARAWMPTRAGPGPAAARAAPRLPGDQQDRPGEPGRGPAADRRRQRAHGFAETFIVSALRRQRVRGAAGGRGPSHARGPVAVPRGPALRPVRPGAGGRDHPRADLPPPAPGAALQHHGRDRGLGRGARRQRGADRPDDLRAALQPEADPDRQEGPAAQGDRRGRARRSSSGSWASGCTCSCSSRSARTGSTTPSATARWGSTSSAEAARCGRAAPTSMPRCLPRARNTGSTRGVAVGWLRSRHRVEAVITLGGPEQQL